jgi:hypothetical protein
MNDEKGLIGPVEKDLSLGGQGFRSVHDKV